MTALVTPTADDRDLPAAELLAAGLGNGQTVVFAVNATWAVVKTLPGMGSVQAVSFAPDSLTTASGAPLLVVGSADSSVVVYSAGCHPVSDWTAVAQLHSHTASVTSLSWSMLPLVNGSFLLASGSIDGTTVVHAAQMSGHVPDASPQGRFQ